MTLGILTFYGVAFLSKEIEIEGKRQLHEKLSSTEARVCLIGEPF